jgi:Polyketide cyclase / dehydrase and lipid transport
MAIIEYTADIPLPRAQVYQISQDYSVRYDWDPFPDQLTMLDGSDYSPRIGGQVYIRSKLGMAMTVEFVKVNPPHNAAIKMVSEFWPLEKFAGSWLYEEIDEDNTRVRFRYLVKVRGFIFKPFIEWLAAAYFSKVTRKRLLGLKGYCKTVGCAEHSEAHRSRYKI